MRIPLTDRSGTGAATLTTPVGGFDSDDLRTYLGRLAPTGLPPATRDISTSNPTSKPKSTSKSNIGAIVGGTLGGLAALILLLLLALFCLRRRKKALASSPNHPPNDKHHPSPDLPLDNQRATFTNSTKHQPSINTPQDSPPPSWQPVAVNYIPQYQQRFMEDLPQQHYNPAHMPPPPVLYYPPPSLPQQWEQATPTYELPNVRSPSNAGERGFGGRTTASAHQRINEE